MSVMDYYLWWPLKEGLQFKLWTFQLNCLFHILLHHKTPMKEVAISTLAFLIFGVQKSGLLRFCRLELVQKIRTHMTWPNRNSYKILFSKWIHESFASSLAQDRQLLNRRSTLRTVYFPLLDRPVRVKRASVEKIVLQKTTEIENIGRF